VLAAGSAEPELGADDGKRQVVGTESPYPLGHRSRTEMLPLLEHFISGACGLATAAASFEDR